MQAGEVIKGAFKRHRFALEESERLIFPDVERGAEILSEAARSGHTLFVCGNGGSAADSQHLAAEWTCRYKKERGPLPAIALTVDTSAITAIGNDYSFEEVFSRQIKALGKKGDVLVAITTSGGSKNVLRAIESAKSRGLKVIALTGEKGETLRASVDVAIVVPTTETSRIQEMHELVYHAWCEYVDESF